MAKTLNLRDYSHLIVDGLVKARRDDATGRVILKYSRNVFYRNLWNKDPLLVEARGHVFDSATGNLLVAPPTKVFNLHENGAGSNIGLHDEVSVVRKVNGFLACVTWIDGEMVVSTTGSLDSDFVKLARKHVEKLNWSFMNSNPHFRSNEYTFHFEIVDESDPHIVEEEEGAYLIGCRRLRDLVSANEWQLDDVAMYLECKRPSSSHWFWGDLLAHLPEVEHEGFMVRDIDEGETLVKLKSPHYLTKKFLMRMGQSRVDDMFEDTEAFCATIDEEFYSIVRNIVRNHTAEWWKNKTDQERRVFVEQYYEDRQS